MSDDNHTVNYAHEHEGDLHTVTRRYRQAPGGWWWIALPGVPLLLALLTGVGSDGEETAVSSPTDRPSASATTTSPSSPSASGRPAGSPPDARVAAAGKPSAPGTPATTTTAPPSATTGTGGNRPTATVTVTVTPSNPAGRGSASGSANPSRGEAPRPSAAATDPADIACGSFSRDVAAVLEAHPIAFTAGGATLTPASTATVGRIATSLRRCASVAAVVTGHTDNTGSPAKNLQVSAARAAAVRAALVAAGVPGGRIASVGAGSDRPVARNDTEAGRAQNRRVEIVAN